MELKTSASPNIPKRDEGGDTAAAKHLAWHVRTKHHLGLDRGKSKGSADTGGGIGSPAPDSLSRIFLDDSLELVEF